MNNKELQEVLSKLDRRVDDFSYTRDSYCLQLLRYEHGSSERISNIKKGPFQALLDKPSIRGLTARQGDGRMNLERAAVTGARRHDFRISYSLWKGRDRWDQVSRPGWQLVLQLNFPEQHDQAYLNKVKPRTQSPFAYGGHPVRQDVVHTLAWARIDLDPICCEALIEEIQTDWLREADRLKRDCRTYKDRRWMRKNIKRECEDEASLERILEYIESDLRPYRQLWSEALLSACLWLLVEELGFRKIYMHSRETGAVLKNCRPPRSLYTKLPRRFCMQQVEYGPGMICAQRSARKALRKIDRPYWFRHRFRRVRHDQA